MQRRRFLTLFAVVLLGSGLAVQGQEMNTQYLDEIYRTLNRAMVQKDIVTLDRLLDDHFTLTHITGYVQSKSEWLADVKSGRMAYSDIREVRVSSKRQGDIASIVGQAHTTANIWGTQGTWRLQLDYRAEYRRNEWKVMRAVATLF